MKRASKIDYSELAGVAIGAMAPGLLTKFAGDIVNKLPAPLQPLLPVGIGVALVSFAGRNTLLKSAGIGMVGTSVANFARVQFGIGSTDMDEIGAISYEVIEPANLLPMSATEEIEYLGAMEDEDEDEINGLDDLEPVAGIEDLAPVAGLF